MCASSVAIVWIKPCFAASSSRVSPADPAYLTMPLAATASTCSSSSRLAYGPALLAEITRKRIRELGIRVALGAQRNEVLKAALGHAFRLLAFGSAAGLLLGILASRVLAFIVYEATPRDPVVLAGVVVAMACWA
jgi:predicted lysophospholipase L1 biosynthesis ABC-type transport system permease subunit